MKFGSSELLGFIAATLTTISFIPQLMKIIKTKETKDISLLMYIVLALGILLWLIYGFLIFAFPVIIANGVVLILALVIIVLKIKYG